MPARGRPSLLPAEYTGTPSLCGLPARPQPLTFDPDLPSPSQHLSLPDGYLVLYRLYHVPAGLESLGAMGRRDSHRDAHVADLESAHAVHHLDHPDRGP